MVILKKDISLEKAALIISLGYFLLLSLIIFLMLSLIDGPSNVINNGLQLLLLCLGAAFIDTFGFYVGFIQQNTPNKMIGKIIMIVAIIGAVAALAFLFALVAIGAGLAAQQR